MKRLFVIITSLILIIGCSKPINNKTLVNKYGVKYQQNTQKPFSGKVFELWDNGNRKLKGSYKEGKENGLWTGWYENGKKKVEGTYKNGELDGKSTTWYKNGQKEGEGTYKDEKLDGKFTNWYENGEKRSEGTFKNGKQVGEWTYYNEDGSIKEVKEY